MSQRTIQVGWDDDEPISWPAKWEICHDCRGEGSRVLHGMAFTSADIDEAGGQDFIDDMRSGLYDTVCEGCNGEGKTLIVDEEALDKHEIARLHMIQREIWESHAADRSEAQAFGYDR